MTRIATAQGRGTGAPEAAARKGQPASAEKAFAAKAKDAQGKAAAPAAGKSAPGKPAPDKSPPSKPETAKPETGKPAAAAPNMAKPQPSRSAPASNPLEALAKAGEAIGQAGAQFANGFRAGAQETRERVSTVAQHLAGTPPEWIAREKPIPQTGSLPEAVGKAVSSVIGNVATLPLMPADNYLKARQEADAKGMPHDQAKAKANASYWLGAAEMSTSALPPGPAAIMSGLVETGRQLQAGERDLGRIAQRATESALASYALDKAGDRLGDILGGKGTGGGGPGAPGRMPGELEPVRVGADPASPAPRAPEPNQPSRMAGKSSGGGDLPKGTGRGMSMAEAVELASREGDLQGIPDKMLDPAALGKVKDPSGKPLRFSKSDIDWEVQYRIAEKMTELMPANQREAIEGAMEFNGFDRPSIDLIDEVVYNIESNDRIRRILKEEYDFEFKGSDVDALMEYSVQTLAKENPLYLKFSRLPRME